MSASSPSQEQSSAEETPLMLSNISLQIDQDLSNSQQPPLKKTKMADNKSNESSALDAKLLNRYSRQNAALGELGGLPMIHHHKIYKHIANIWCKYLYLLHMFMLYHLWWSLSFKACQPLLTLERLIHHIIPSLIIFYIWNKLNGYEYNMKHLWLGQSMC